VTIDAKALSLAADSCWFTISGAFALLRVRQMFSRKEKTGFTEL
jgi:hypothetical protein